MKRWGIDGFSCCCSVTKSCLTLQPHEQQHASLSCPSLSPAVCSNSCSNHWIGDAFQPCHLLLCPSPPSLNLSQYQGLFQWVCSLNQVAKVLELQLQHQSFQWIFRLDFLYDWLLWYICSPKDSQESSPAQQFESINSLVFCILYNPALTSVHDYWKNHSFDYMYLYQQSDVSDF